MLIILSFLLLFALTDSSPATDTRLAPTAEQVSAGRDALLQLRDARSAASGVNEIKISSDHLDGLSALATHAFRPDRLDLFVFESILHVNASHKLPFGRWLNVIVEIPGSKEGFPNLRAVVGSVSLSPYFSRLLIELVRSGMLVIGADIPSLDDLIQHLAIRDNRIAATINLPDKMGVFDRLMGMQNNIDPLLIAEVYCRLANAQQLDPQNNLATQVRRAFPRKSAAKATPESNGAALVALAMAIVDKKAGLLAGLSASQAGACEMPASRITLYDREDLPKHWALSAALAVGPGMQIAEAMGEWKELADNLSNQSEFQPGDPTGFSFVDIAADRSGLRIAKAASDETSARKMAIRLSSASENGILPPELLLLEEGQNVDFVRKYVSIDHPRFAEAIRSIDVKLDQKSLLAP